MLFTIPYNILIEIPSKFFPASLQGNFFNISFLNHTFLFEITSYLPPFLFCAGLLAFSNSKLKIASPFNIVGPKANSITQNFCPKNVPHIPSKSLQTQKIGQVYFPIKINEAGNLIV